MRALAPGPTLLEIASPFRPSRLQLAWAMSARFQAARYGPEFGDAIAVLFDTQTKKVVQTWVSSSLGFAKSDIVRGTEIPRDEVEWISSDDMNALMESEA